MPAILTLLADGEVAHALVDTEGIVHALNQGTGYSVLVGEDGRWGQQLAFAEAVTPLRPGAHVRQVNVRPGDVSWPILIEAPNRAALDGQIATMVGWIDATRGPIAFRHTGAGGTVREIAGYGTIVAPEDADAKGELWQIIVLTIHAADDPFWVDAAATVQTSVANVTPATWFGRPWFPFKLQSSSVFSTLTVANDGDADIDPNWVITGPGSGLVLLNQTTGKRLGVTRTLLAGEQIIIDTAAATVTDGLGTSLLSSVPLTDDFWPLIRGSQTVQVELNAASAASSVALSYRQRWLGPAS